MNKETFDETLTRINLLTQKYAHVAFISIILNIILIGIIITMWIL